MTPNEQELIDAILTRLESLAHTKSISWAAAEQQLRALFASAATVAEPSDKLEAPAQVGNTVFGKGVEKRLVIEAAQRNHQRTHNPTEEDKRIAAGVESLLQLRRQIEAEHDAKSPFQREVEKMRNRGCQGTVDTCPNECSSPCQSQTAQQQAEPGAYHVEHRTNACSEVVDKNGETFATCAWSTDAAERAQRICDLLNGAKAEPRAWCAEHQSMCPTHPAAQQQAEPGADESIIPEHWRAKAEQIVGDTWSLSYDAERARQALMLLHILVKHDRHAQSGQRAANASDDLWNEKLILKIVEELNVMFASAKCEVDESDGITGYRIKTGALHRIVGALTGIGQSVSIPANMPVVGQRAGAAEDARDAARWRTFERALRTGHLRGTAYGHRFKIIETCPMSGDEKEFNAFVEAIDAAIAAAPTQQQEGGNG